MSWAIGLTRLCVIIWDMCELCPLLAQADMAFCAAYVRFREQSRHAAWPTLDLRPTRIPPVLSSFSLAKSSTLIEAFSFRRMIMSPESKLIRTDSAAEGGAIRTFSFKAAEAELADLRKRIVATKWPEREQVGDATQGVQLATMQKLAQYWANEHDWRKCEAKINAVPNFITEIDGLDIHFIHVRSKHENALPIIVTHGWPGSFIEQMKIIEPLTNPTAHGGTAADAFHLVIPSLPGYGFSGKPAAPGWNPVTIAKAWATLMQRLGYAKYVAQGGDWGAIISEVMA